jgi:hypothetical protein
MATAAGRRAVGRSTMVERGSSAATKVARSGVDSLSRAFCIPIVRKVCT